MKKKEYSKEIMEYLGNEYLNIDGATADTVYGEIIVQHKKCGTTFPISWKKCGNGYSKNVCPKCFYRGEEKNEDSRLVQNLYNGKFILRSVEMINNHKHFNISHIGCPNENESFRISKEFFVKGDAKGTIVKCQFCESKTSKEAAQSKLDKIFPGEYILLTEEKFIKINTPEEMLHTPCNKIIRTRINNIINMGQSGCKYCGMKKAGDVMKNKVSKQRMDEIKERFGDRFEFYSEYDGYHTKIDGYDFVEDRYFSLKPSDIIKKALVPHKSKGATEIESFLRKNNIEFETEVSFPDLKDKKPLRFDFRIKESGILIEFDGEQHFRRRRDDKDGFKLKRTQEHDKMKNDYCAANDIKLIRIKYSQRKSIEKILTREVLNSEN